MYETKYASGDNLYNSDEARIFIYVERCAADILNFRKFIHVGFRRT